MGGVIAKKRTAGTGRYLSLFERERIASLRDRGNGIREIARRVGRSPSTVSRELARNARVWDDGYDPVMAHLRAHERARSPKAEKIEQSPWLRSFIQDRLNRRWSPEQIHPHLAPPPWRGSGPPGVGGDDLSVPLQATRSRSF